MSTKQVVNRLSNDWASIRARLSPDEWGEFVREGSQIVAEMSSDPQSVESAWQGVSELMNRFPATRDLLQSYSVPGGVRVRGIGGPQRPDHEQLPWVRNQLVRLFTAEVQVNTEDEDGHDSGDGSDVDS
jgi:hypothetical protein